MKIGIATLKSVFLFLFSILTCNTSFGDSSALIEKVCANLNLKIEECYVEFAAEKVMPADSSKSIVVIPKIAEQEEDYFSLDSLLLD